MIENLFFTLTLLSALGCGLMAGVFFIFSNTVMSALARLQPPQGIAAMQSINITIINPLFFIVSFGTAVMSIVLPVSLIWKWEELQGFYLIAGSICYLVGVMLVTIVFNIPMNNALEAVEPTSDEATKLWNRYLINWTNWNHVRTIAAFLGSLFFILALT